MLGIVRSGRLLRNISLFTSKASVQHSTEVKSLYSKEICSTSSVRVQKRGSSKYVSWRSCEVVMDNRIYTL